MLVSQTERVTKLRSPYIQSREIAEKRKEKRRKGLRRRLVAFAVVFTAICSLMIWSLSVQIGRLNAAEAQKAALEKQVDTSQQRTGQLKKRIRLLNDKKYIGEIARQDYLLSKKGEIIFSKPDKSGD
jgi:cell division protein DivIC